ncbi:MAG: ATP-binding protein [Candidatus Peribacteraceae bacterium]|nr:ATP-binding protein [Candidatus Peribacteraceae bacterium]
MSKIKVRNFGPIKTGYIPEDGFLDIRKVTVFIGNQGSGKSTITKLISTLSWLEKALLRGELKEKDITKSPRFIKRYCAYQNIQSYFKDNTEIEYRGKAYSFIYKEGKLTITTNKTNGYLVPKIMYVPAERNFVSSVDEPEKLKNLPKSLVTFLDEFLIAQEKIKEGISLPINETTFEYDKLNRIANIKGSDYKLRLSESSSGFQSSVPLFLVSRSLAHLIGMKEADDANERQESVEQVKRLRTEIRKIYENEKLSDTLKKVAIEELSAKFTNACFINIVEEPEQNLYPSSQRNILNSLLEFVNLTKGNELIVTTHSPYIVNYLTLSIMGSIVLKKINKLPNKEILRKKLNDIVPLASCVKSNECSLYELNDDGSIVELQKHDDLLSDDNFLNKILSDTNFLFDELIGLEDSI